MALPIITVQISEDDENSFTAKDTKNLIRIIFLVLFNEDQFLVHSGVKCH